MGENDLFLVFYRPIKAIYAVQWLQKAVFRLFLSVILACRPMDTCAISYLINSSAIKI